MMVDQVAWPLPEVGESPVPPPSLLAPDFVGGVETARAARPTLRIEWAEDISPLFDRLWLVKNLLPDEGLAVLFGHPGSGKSFFAVDVGMHVALGWDWSGHRTRRGTVVYIAAEGQKGLRNRIVAFRKHHGISSMIPFALIPQALDLFESVNDWGALKEWIAHAVHHYNLPPALIIVDTISQTLGNGRENTDDLAVYVGHCNRLAAEFHCCVLLIHHRPKDGVSNKPRGHGSLEAGVDTVLLVQGGATRSVTITKQRDGQDGGICRFRLRPINIGVDEDGEQVWSCVVAQVSGVDANAAEPKDRASRRSESRCVVLEALREVLGSGDGGASSEIPTEIIGDVREVAHLSDFRNHASKRLRTTSDSKPDSLRRMVRRHEKALQASGKVNIWEGFIWLVS